MLIYVVNTIVIIPYRIKNYGKTLELYNVYWKVSLALSITIIIYSGYYL